MVDVSGSLAQPCNILLSLARGGEDLRLLEILRKRFPKAKVMLLMAEEKYWQVRDKGGDRNDAMTYSIHVRKLFGKEHRELVQRLKAGAFDLGITTEEGDVVLSDILLYRSGARLRVGQRRPGCFPFLNCLVDSLEDFFQKGLAK